MNRRLQCSIRFVTMPVTVYVHVKALDYTMPEYVDSLYRYIGEFRKKVLLSRWVQVEGKYTVVTGGDLDEIKVKE